MNPKKNEDVEYYIMLDGINVSVSKEVYQAYYNPIDAEKKYRKRIVRCRGKGGNRCNEDCSTCKQVPGGALSYDKLTDDGYEIPDYTDGEYNSKVEYIASQNILLEQLSKIRGTLPPEDEALLTAIFDNHLTEREYALELGISHQAVNKRKKKIIEKLRILMKIDV